MSRSRAYSSTLLLFLDTTETFRTVVVEATSGIILYNLENSLKHLSIYIVFIFSILACKDIKDIKPTSEITLSSPPKKIDSFIAGIKFPDSKRITTSLTLFSEVRDTFYPRSFHDITVGPMAVPVLQVSLFGSAYHFQEAHISGKHLASVGVEHSDNKYTSVFLKYTLFDICKFGTAADTGIYYAFHDGLAFLSHVDFINCFFAGNNVFKDAVFSERVSFGQYSPAKYYYPIFYNSEFQKELDFSGHTSQHELTACGFSTDLVFVKCKLGTRLTLAGCKFDSSKLILRETCLPDTLDLSGSTFLTTIDLTETFLKKKDKKCQLNLLSTDIPNLKLRYDKFHLYFPEKVLTDPNSHDLISATYEALLDNFKKRGYQSSYKEADIEYKEWLSQKNWLLKLSDYWWRFGYEKWRILVITLLSFLIFTVWNYQIYTSLQKTYPIENLSWNKLRYHPRKSYRIFRKFFVVFFYTALVFFRFTLDYKNIRFQQTRFLVVLLSQFIWGLLCIGFLLNWIFQG